MPRKKVICSLPPLRRRSRARRSEVTDEYLLDIFGKLAATHRRAHPQVFYTLRDAARQLRAPISAVSRVYGELKREGILVSVRGSKTMLEGSGRARRLTIKSFVGLPVSYSCFMTLHDYRRFYFELRKESKRRGIVSNLIFFDEHPHGMKELGQTLEEFGFDSVVWFLPTTPAREIVLRLADRGVRVVGVADGGRPGIPCRYEIRREKAVAAILKVWKRDAKIHGVRIIRASKYSAADEEMLEHAANEVGLEYEHLQVRNEAIPKAVASMCEDTSKGVVLAAASAARFSLLAPQALGELLKTCRVAFPDGPVTAIFGHIPHRAVELVTVDWAHVANKIVSDLLTKRAFREGPPSIFEATPRLRVVLDDYTEMLTC